ncbi:MAG: IS110 family transposase [Candidatus Binataceae bacterium]
MSPGRRAALGAGTDAAGAHGEAFASGAGGTLPARPKHDANDAAAVCEAVTRPQLRAVAVKSVAQQDVLALHRLRTLLVKQATAWANQLRALLHERGVVVAQGGAALRRMLADLPADQPELSDCQ